VHSAHDDLVIKSNDAIKILNVKNPRNVLVTDTLNAVVTETVDEKSWALISLTGSDLDGGELGAKVLTRRKSTSATLSKVDTNKGFTILGNVVIDLLESTASHMVVPERVGKLSKLVEGDNLALASPDKLVVLIEHGLDRALTARGGINLSADGLEPVETLLRHKSRKNSDGGAAKKTAVEGTTTAVVASAGPKSLLACGIEVARDHLLHKRTVRSTYLVGTSGEVTANKHDNTSLSASEERRNLDVVGESIELTTRLLRLVLPSDTEKVTRVNIPEANALKFLNNLRRHLLRVHEHIISRKKNTLFSTALYTVLKGDFRSRHNKFFSRHLQY